MTTRLEQVITGGVVSMSVTVWLQGALLLLQLSMACHVRVTVAGQLPFVTVLITLIVTLVPLQLSFAVGKSKVHAEPHSTVLLLTQVMVGGVVSTIVTVWLQLAELVQQSTAV